MATEGGGKIKSKRQTGESKPYSRRQSLLGRVTNTMRDMLSPSWMIDLVNGVRKSPPKQGGDNDLHQEPDGEIPVRRELNRLSADDNFTPAMPTTQPHSSAPIMPPTNHPMAGFSHNAPPSGHYTPYRPPAPVPQHVMTNGDDQSDAGEYSHGERKDYHQGEIIQMNDSHLRQLQHQMEMGFRSMPSNAPPPPHQQPPPHIGGGPNTVSNTSMNTGSVNATATDAGNTSTTSMESSFLWSSSKPRTSKPQAPAKSQVPSFNSSLLSPGKGSSPNFHQSPYYPGKTTFGGASSFRRARLKQTPGVYEPSPSRKQVQAKPLNNSSLSGVTSSTAKRILDTLERMSTPLSDAKKIPLDGNLSDSMLSMTPGTYRRRRTPNTSLSQSMNEGPPTSRRTLSSFASIAPNVHKTPSGGPSMALAESSQPTASNDTQYQVASSTRGGGGRSGKMKRERGSHYSSKQTDEDEVEAPMLSTSFVLPVSNFTLPPFGLAATTSTLAAKTADSSASSSKMPVSTSVAFSTNAPQSSTGLSGDVSFSFSSPIVKSTTVANSPISGNTAQFQFSSPITVDKDSSAAQPRTSIPVPSSGFSFSTASTAPKMKSPAVNFKPSDEAPSDGGGGGGGLKPASELKTGSVMDVLGKPAVTELQSGSGIDVLGKKPTPNGNIGGLQPASELKTGSVMDILGGKKAAITSNSSSGGGQKSFSEMFKPSAGEWTCDVCLVQNKADLTKCAACETAKPAPKPASTSSSNGGQKSLSEMFKPSGGECETTKSVPKPASAVPPVSSGLSSSGPPLSALFGKKSGWTCDTCLVDNKEDALKCVACEGAKPGPKPSTKSSSGGIPAGLAHLAKPAADWTCDVCLVNNKPDVAKCAACETPKPGAAPEKLKANNSSDPAAAAPFKFGSFGSTKKPTSDWECDTCLVINKPESNKCVACEMPKPGAQPPSGFTSAGGFSFGNTASSSSAPSGGFKFGAPSSSTATNDKSDSTPAATGFVPPSSGGFSFGKPADKKDDSKQDEPAVGGFKFGALATGNDKPKDNAAGAKPAFGGFAFGQPTTGESAGSGSDDKSKLDTSAPASTAPAYGGFKFGAPGSTTITTKDSAVATSGTSSKTDSATAAKPAGGFAFGQSAKSASETQDDDKAAAPESNFTFGKPGATTAAAVSDAKPTMSTAASPFQFGVPVKDANGNESKPLGGAGGFKFSTTDTKAVGSLPSPAFQFNAKPAETKPKETALVEPSKSVFGAATTDKPTAGPGGFSFDPTGTTNTPSTEGFVFGAKTDASKPAVSAGFAFGAGSGTSPAFGSAAKITDSKPPMSAPFQFTGNSAKQPSIGNAAATAGLPTPNFSFNKPAASNAVASPGKRGRDDMEGGSDAKKPSISFGPTPALSSGFKFGETKTATTTSSSSGFTFGQANTSAFGTNNGSNSSSTGGFAGFSAGGQSTTTTPATGSVFGAPSQPATTGGSVFGSSSTTFGSANPAPAFATPTSNPNPAGGFNMSTPTTFNFNAGPGNSAPGSGVFQFSANTNNQNNAAASAGSSGSTNFTFGQATQAAAPAAAQAPVPAFSATPNFNFSANSASAGQQQQQAPGGVFNFSASGGASAPDANPFSASSASNQNNNARRFKKAVRKLRK